MVRGIDPTKIEENESKKLLLRLKGNEYNRCVDLAKIARVSMQKLFEMVIPKIEIKSSDNDTLEVESISISQQEEVKPQKSRSKKQCLDDDAFIKAVHEAVGDFEHRLNRNDALARIKICRLRAIEECIRSIASPRPGTPYDWLPGSPLDHAVGLVIDRLKDVRERFSD